MLINNKNKYYFNSLILLAIIVPMILLSQNAYASQEVSKDPSDWYFKKIGPRNVDMWGDKFTQIEYIFQDSENPPCLKNCPYKFPVWDGKINTINKILRHIGLPEISTLRKTNDKKGREYTDPNYPMGEILIFKGKYFDHFWKVIIRKR